MQEITDKLAGELLAEIEKLENWCDKKAIENRRDTASHTDWVTAACFTFGLRVHLLHHMQDMIKHPGQTDSAKAREEQ